MFQPPPKKKKKYASVLQKLKFSGAEGSRDLAGKLWSNEVSLDEVQKQQCVQAGSGLETSISQQRC